MGVRQSFLLPALASRDVAPAAGNSEETPRTDFHLTSESGGLFCFVFKHAAEFVTEESAAFVSARAVVVLLFSPRRYGLVRIQRGLPGEEIPG